VLTRCSQIIGVQALLKWAPKARDSEPSWTPSLMDKNWSAVRVLRLAFPSEYGALHANGDMVGVLEDRALPPLKALASGPSPVKYEAAVTRSEWDEKMSLVDSHARKGQRLTIDIDIFGPLARADDVAK